MAIFPVRELLRYALVVSLSLAIAGCEPGENYYFARVEGHVKKDTGEPVAGALLLIKWEVQFGAHAVSWACTWLALVETDEHGHYSYAVEPHKMKGRNRAAQRDEIGGFPVIRAYKRGMTIKPAGGVGSISYDEAAVRKADSFFYFGKPMIITLKQDLTARPASLNTSERIREFDMLSYPERGCESFEDLTGISRFYKAIADESREIAKSDREKAVAEVIAARAERPVGANANDPEIPITIRKYW